MKPIVAYVRVSTSQQGRSGLGIEAQREALGRFASDEGFEIVAGFIEVETAREATRRTADRNWRRRSPRRGLFVARSWLQSWTDSLAMCISFLV